MRRNGWRGLGYRVLLEGVVRGRDGAEELHVVVRGVDWDGYGGFEIVLSFFVTVERGFWTLAVQGDGSRGRKGLGAEFLDSGNKRLGSWELEIGSSFSIGWIVEMMFTV